MFRTALLAVLAALLMIVAAPAAAQDEFEPYRDPSFGVFEPDAFVTDDTFKWVEEPPTPFSTFQGQIGTAFIFQAGGTYTSNAQSRDGGDQDWILAPSGSFSHTSEFFGDTYTHLQIGGGVKLVESLDDVISDVSRASASIGLTRLLGGASNNNDPNAPTTTLSAGLTVSDTETNFFETWLGTHFETAVNLSHARPRVCYDGQHARYCHNDTFRGGYNFVAQNNAGTDKNIHRIGLTAQRKWGREGSNWTLLFSVGGEFSSFDPETGSDSESLKGTFGVTAIYKLNPTTQFRVGVGYTIQDSSVDMFDYDAISAPLSIRLTIPLGG